MEYKQPMEVYAVVFGYLIRTFGKIQMSKVNKIVGELEYDKVNGTLLKDYAEQIEEDEHLSDILEKAINGEVTPDELKKYNTDIAPIDSEEALHKVITPYVVSHQRVLKNNREFNKLQRRGAYTKMLFEDLKKDLRDVFKDSPFNNEDIFDYTYDPVKKTVVVLISDWHIGATVEDHSYHGGYNFDILNARLQYLLEKTAEVVTEQKAEKIVCMFAGDLIEGADMRGGQKWGLEFSMSEQIAKGENLLISFVNSLSKLAPTTFGAIRGNHDRLTGQVNKKDNIYNDSAVYIVLDTMKYIQEEFGALNNVELIDNAIDMYNAQLDIYGKVMHVNHGDALKGKGSHFAKFIEDRAINYLITGHIHTFEAKQDHKDHLHLVVGSPMGYNNYAKELHLTKTAPSQTIMVLPEEGSPQLMPVFMDHIGLKETK